MRGVGWSLFKNSCIVAWDWRSGNCKSRRAALTLLQIFTYIARTSQQQTIALLMNVELLCC